MRAMLASYAAALRRGDRAATAVEHHAGVADRGRPRSSSSASKSWTPGASMHPARIGKDEVDEAFRAGDFGDDHARRDRQPRPAPAGCSDRWWGWKPMV